MYHVEVVSLLYRFGCGIISKLACHPYNGPRRTVPDHLHATLATSDIAMKRAQKRVARGRRADDAAATHRLLCSGGTICDAISYITP